MKQCPQCKRFWDNDRIFCALCVDDDDNVIRLMDNEYSSEDADEDELEHNAT